MAKRKALDIIDVRAMTDSELNDKLVELKKEQFNMRFQQATGQLETTAHISQVRKDIARIKTVMSQKKSAAKAEG